MVSLHLVKFFDRKMNSVVFVDQGVMGRAHKYPIRVSISFADGHAWVAARAAIFLSHDVCFLPERPQSSLRSAPFILATAFYKTPLHCRRSITADRMPT